MCGKIKFSDGRWAKIGEPLPITIQKTITENHIWDGHARQEKLMSTWHNSLQFGFVPGAIGYDEHGQEFDFDGYLIVGITKRPIFKYAKGIALVITRPAFNDDEKKVWPRHPLIVGRKG